ncbi:uncharacterized protein ACO6RY_01280 [Pungitius sinensis]
MALEKRIAQGVSSPSPPGNQHRLPQLDLHQQIELAPKNSDLFSWEVEKAEMMEALKAERRLRRAILAEKKALEEQIAPAVSSPSPPGNQRRLPQLDLHQQIELAPKNSDSFSWEVEKAEMMEALKAERRLRRAILAEKKALEKQIAPAVSSPSPPGNQGHLPQPVPHHPSTSTEHQDLSKTIVDVQQQVELAPEKSDLMKQMAIKERSWEVEKAKIMKALQAERGLKRQILAEKMALEKQLAPAVSSPSQSGNQGRLPQPVPDHQSPCTHHQDLSKALSDIQQQVELEPEKRDLMKQMAIKERSWEVEKAKIMKALQAERGLKRQILAEKMALEKQLTPAVSSPSQSRNQGCLPQPVPDHQSPCTDHQDLSKALSDIQQQVELAPEKSDLMKQMAMKERSWEVEKAKIMKALQAERGVKRQILTEKIALEKQLAPAVSSSGNQGRLPQPVSDHQSPCTDNQDLSKGNSDIKKQVNKLYLENPVLEEKMVTKEVSWEHEKAKIMKALESEMSVRKQAEADKKVIEMVNLEWEKRWFAREEEYSARLKTLQDDFDRKNSQIIMEKDNLITNTTSEKRALEKLNLSEVKLKQQESKMILMEAEWKINLAALENQMRDEFAEKEARILDFQRAWEKETTDMKFALEMKEKEIAIIHSEAECKMKCATPDQHHHSFLALHEGHFQRERESETLNGEMNKELLLKVNRLEENIRLLTQEKNDLRIWNLRLQETAQKTDKERVQMKKEEKKLAKEKEMILKKQMKESAKIEKELLKKQKKEREENEKRQKEALKKQKKGK